MAFYKTVSPFQRYHVIQPTFLKQGEAVVTRKAFIGYDGTAVRMGGRLFEYARESGNIKGTPKVLFIIYLISVLAGRTKFIT